MKTDDGVTLKNAGAQATRGTKGLVSAQNRGRFGFDFSISRVDPEAPNGVRVLYINRQDAEDLADVLDAVLDATT